MSLPLKMKLSTIRFCSKQLQPYKPTNLYRYDQLYLLYMFNSLFNKSFPLILKKNLIIPTATAGPQERSGQAEEGDKRTMAKRAKENGTYDYSNSLNFITNVSSEPIALKDPCVFRVRPRAL